MIIETGDKNYPYKIFIEEYDHASKVWVYIRDKYGLTTAEFEPDSNQDMVWQYFKGYEVGSKEVDTWWIWFKTEENALRFFTAMGGI
jgi:hypothetical protein